MEVHGEKLDYFRTEKKSRSSLTFSNAGVLEIESQLFLIVL